MDTKIRIRLKMFKKCTVKPMVLLLVLLCSIEAVFAATPGSPQGHCCQNVLCPIDCVRCDGKATCYDLSDELGCSNISDKRLLAYEKPPVFVPIILAVLKAQLRREKVELAFRFPDRDCFAAPVPSNDITDRKKLDVVSNDEAEGPFTTEMPVWVQLLMKLKSAFGETSTTTTTTQMPVWKMLLNKLKAEDNGNGETYTTTAANVKSWTEKITTTPLTPVSQTPPWRKTVKPVATQEKDNVTTEGTVDLAVKNIITTAPTKKTVTGIPVDITTESSSNAELTSVETISSTPGKMAGPDASVTFKETVFFIPPDQSATTTTIAPSTEEVSVVKTSTSDLATSIETSTVSVSDLSTMTSPSYNETSTMKFDNSTYFTENSNKSVNTEAINIEATATVDLVQVEVGTNHTGLDNTTDKTLLSTITNNTNFIEELKKINISDINTASGTDIILTEDLELNITKIDVVSFNATMFDTANGSDVVNLENKTDRLNKTDQVGSEPDLIATDLPILVTENYLGVTMSTEYVKTVTESETPSPIRQKIVTNPFIEKHERNTTGIPVGIIISNEILNSLNENNQPLDQNYTEAQSVQIQIEINMTEIVNNTSESEIHGNLTDPYDVHQIGNISEINDTFDANTTNIELLNSSSVSNTSADTSFSYSSEDIPGQQAVNTTVKYFMEDTGITGFDLYNNTYQKDVLQTYNSTEKRDSFSVSINNLSPTGDILKDKVGSSSTTRISPENEVRIMLGRLNALVRKEQENSAFQSLPTLREFNHTDPASVNIQQIVTVTPAPVTPLQVTMPTTRGPTTQTPVRASITQADIAQTQPLATVTPSPWWGQTTLAPFSLDNLFGFTPQPLFDQNWRYPTTNAWDSFFGIGGVPVTQSPFVPPYDYNQDRLNNIYNPLLGQIQPTTNAPSAAIGNVNTGTTIRPTDFTQPASFTGAPMQTVDYRSNSFSPSVTVNTDNTRMLEPTTQRPVSINLFNAQIDAYSPGNFSISGNQGKSTRESNLYTVSDIKTDQSGNVEPTVPAIVERVPFETVTFSPVTFPSAKQPDSKSFIDNIVSNNRITTGSLEHGAAYSPVTTPSTLITRTTGTYVPSVTVKNIPTGQPNIPAYTEPAQNIWNLQTQAPSIPVARPVPTTTTAPPLPAANPSTGVPVWNYESNRVLSTDVISSWWSQMQPTTPAPVYMAPPTPTPMPTGERCYEVQDSTGFCQTRMHGNYKNPSDCRSFYVCIWGFMHICTCPQNTMFDDRLSVCNWDHQVTCKTQL